MTDSARCIDTVVLDAAADATSLAVEDLDITEQVEHFHLNEHQAADLKAVLDHLTPDVLHEAVRLAASNRPGLPW